ncbi:MAG: pilM [Candidatus Doudnabacteria bacterium]|nr:pilM [Candidatus Doudnabacteria bacterium]
MFDIWKQKKIPFGLDLSDLSIKVMQLQKKGKSYKIVAYSDYPLPKGVVVNDNIVNEDLLTNHLKAMLQHVNFGKLRGNQIVASIPESKAFVRVLQIPKMSEEQAVNAVPFEAEQYIPIPLDQAYLDWQIIGERDEKLDVLVTAAPKDYIDTLLRIFKAVGFRPVSFEVESAACTRALISAEMRAKNVLILDMDTLRSSLVVVEKGNLQFTSTVPIAGDAFTQSIARAMGVTDEEAETIKREIGLDDTKEHQSVKAALISVVDNLVMEIRNIIKFHDEHNPEKISQIVLCGGTSKLLHLTSYLYQQLADLDHIDITLGNPWINVFNPQDKVSAPLSREDSLSYTTAIGLAMHAGEIVN